MQEKNLLKNFKFVFIKLLLTAFLFSSQQQIFFWKIDTKEKVIFLTFDDGPHKVYTNEVLKILEEYKIKAVFFVLGELISGNNEVIRQLLQKGHCIGSHTYYHNNYYQLQKKYSIEVCKNLLEKELYETEKELKKIYKDIKIKYLRMPYGFYREWMNEVLNKFDYKVINWTFGYDWYNVSEEEMFKRYCDALQPGAIFLFHDGGTEGARNKTLKVLKRFIEYCFQKGYKFGNIEEWIKK
ncbi:MAG: polysaccharide deacetylase family protein [Endomicrobia bacterium]|nr:polysaccharide deacetylase family protein [Endomicrobiia bacterium]